MMLEADIILRGQGTQDQQMVPIVASPPAVTSDLTFEEWINIVKEGQKGFELHFHSIEAVELTLQTLEGLPKVSCHKGHEEVAKTNGKGMEMFVKSDHSQSATHILCVLLQTRCHLFWRNQLSGDKSDEIFVQSGFEQAKTLLLCCVVQKWRVPMPGRLKLSILFFLFSSCRFRCGSKQTFCEVPTPSTNLWI